MSSSLQRCRDRGQRTKKPGALERIDTKPSAFDPPRGRPALPRVSGSAPQVTPPRRPGSLRVARPRSAGYTAAASTDSHDAGTTPQTGAAAECRRTLAFASSTACCRYLRETDFSFIAAIRGGRSEPGIRRSLRASTAPCWASDERSPEGIGAGGAITRVHQLAPGLAVCGCCSVIFSNTGAACPDV